MDGTITSQFGAADDFEEDYPGQTDEIRRRAIIGKAVEVADRVLTDNSDGSIEELDYLTSAVAMKFFEKVHGRNSSKLMQHDFVKRIPERRTGAKEEANPSTPPASDSKTL